MKHQQTTPVAIFVWLYLIFAVQSPLKAQNGFPDPGFGVSGEVMTAPTEVGGEFCAIVHEVAVQPDGKIVAAGSIDDFVALVRYNIDGSIDTDFGIDGVATALLEAEFIFGSTMAIQPDGKILVGSRTMGTSDQDFAMSRFNADGSIDSTFGEDGIVITAFDCNNEHVFTTLLIQPDGMIIGCGTSFCEDPDPTKWRFAVIRYHPDGSLDETFSDDGIVLDELGFWGTGSNVGFAGALQSDGKVVMAGWTSASDGGGLATKFALMRWNTDGSRDTTFGENGAVLMSFGTDLTSVAHALCIQNDGKIVVTGRVHFTEVLDPSDIGLTRFNPNGTLDTTFGDGGFLVTDLGEIFEDAYSVLQQVDGKLVVSGFMGSELDYPDKFATVRYNTDGSIDTDFGTDGLITSDFGVDFSMCYASALQEDGKIIVGGYASGDCMIALARYVSCSAYFTLFPDATPHVWNAVNMAVGTEPMTYLWEWGDGTSSTKPYPSHTYADSGYYNICLTITDGLGCTSTYCDSSTYIYRMDQALTMVTINVWDELPAGTEVFATEIAVTPNPFSDYITIEIPAAAMSGNPESEISIFDLAGNALLKQMITTAQVTINTSQLPVGMYVLCYRNGLEFGTAKLLKM